MDTMVEIVQKPAQPNTRCLKCGDSFKSHQGTAYLCCPTCQEKTAQAMREETWVITEDDYRNLPWYQDVWLDAQDRAERARKLNDQ